MLTSKDKSELYNAMYKEQMNTQVGYRYEVGDMTQVAGDFVDYIVIRLYRWELDQNELFVFVKNSIPGLGEE